MMLKINCSRASRVHSVPSSYWSRVTVCMGSCLCTVHNRDHFGPRQMDHPYYSLERAQKKRTKRKRWCTYDRNIVWPSLCYLDRLASPAAGELSRRHRPATGTTSSSLRSGPSRRASRTRARTASAPARYSATSPRGRCTACGESPGASLRLSA